MSDVGIFHPPVMPQVSGPVSIDPENFQPRRGILTRYGKKLLEQAKQFYGKPDGEAEPVVTKKRRKKKPEYRSIDDQWES